MNRTGPIIIIEDDQDDQEIISNVFATLDYGNEILFFADGYEALKYLTETAPNRLLSFQT